MNKLAITMKEEEGGSEDFLPELFQRRIGFSNPSYPCFFHAHDKEDFSIAYMDQESCKEFNQTLEQIKSLGSAFIDMVVHPDDAERVRSTLVSLINDPQPDKIITYFQRIRLRPEDIEGYTMVLTSAKVDLESGNIYCVSNTTDQLPVLTRKISNALSHKFDLAKKLEMLRSLTKREKQVMELLRQGLQVKQIAEQFFISERTVEQHKKNLYKKIKVNSVAQVVAFASSLNK